MQYVIVADDLTGANDSAAQFASYGLRATTAVAPFHTAPCSETEVMVLDTESRDISPVDAKKTVISGIDCIQSKLDNAVILKKIDSTLRGNISAELEALISAVKPTMVLFAPAFCEAGRTTRDGYQLLDGVKLEKTEFGLSPQSTLKTSYIPKILNEQAELPCAVLSLSLIHGSEDLLYNFLQKNLEKGIKVFVCDAVTPEDLTLAVKLFTNFVPPQKILFTGSAGLARALCRQFITNKRASFEDCKKYRAQRLLFLSGSISNVSRMQCLNLIGAFNCPFLKLNPDMVIRRPEEAVAKALAFIKENSAQKAVLISGALEEQDIKNCQTTAKECGISFFEAGQRYAEVMAGLLSFCADDFDAYFLTGGDTAVHALRAVDATVLEVLGELEDGIALNCIKEGRCKGRLVVSKAGAFGNKDTFLNVCKNLLDLG